MQDNQGKDIRLIVGGHEANTWDDVTIDSQIDVPADAWSLTLFSPSLEAIKLPDTVKAGAKAQIFYGDEQVLAGIVDRINLSISRSGQQLKISGRDMVGQLIDCSVPLKNSRQITLETLLQEFVLSEGFGDLMSASVEDNNWLKNKITVEPSESLFDAISKAAQVTGQFVWFEPDNGYHDGVLRIGDPFKESSQNAQTLTLMYEGANNNILSLEYDEDVSDVFSEIKLLSQDIKGRAITATTTSSTPYAFKRLKIVTMGDIDTQAEAQAAINKIKHDNDLQGYTLTVVVPEWSMNGKVWKTGIQINLQTDVFLRANATWVVMGKTFKLSRTNGKTTELKLKRKSDWVQPLVYKEPIKKPKKLKKTNGNSNVSLGLDEDGYGTYQGGSSS